VAKNHLHKLVLSFRSESTIKISLPFNPKSSSKSLFHSADTPRRQIVTLNGATSKGKVIAPLGEQFPTCRQNLHITKDTSSSLPQGKAPSTPP